MFQNQREKRGRLCVPIGGCRGVFQLAEQDAQSSELLGAGKRGGPVPVTGGDKPEAPVLGGGKRENEEAEIQRASVPEAEAKTRSRANTEN
jgi:hypothetical protein